MTVEDLHRLNVKVQKGAVQLSELIPTGGFAQASSIIIRSSQLMHSFLEKMIHASNERELGEAIERVEDNLDEITFVLDQLEIANKNEPINIVDQFLKEGYEMLSLYSICVNQVMNEKIPTEE